MKKKSSIFVLFILMGIAACSQPTEDTKSMEKEEIVLEVKKTEYGTEKLSLEGKKLEQLTVKGIDDPFYCNLEENLKWESGTEEVSVLVCKDPVYDITYYINYGRDNFIYAYRSGIAELAVKIPAKDLFCKEGELYFIAGTEGQYQFSGFAQGNILKYNPKDGNVSVVEDCSAEKMAVYPEEIVYRQTGEIKQEGSKVLFFSFATGESSPGPIGVSGMRQWKGEWLQVIEEVQELESSEYDQLMQDPAMQELLARGYTFAGTGTGVIDTIKLVDAQGNVKEKLQNVKGIPRDYWIDDDLIYYVKQESGEEETENRSVLRQYNRQTGIHEDIAVLGYLTNLSIYDMIIYNNAAYFSNGLRVELDTGAQCLMQTADGTSSQLECFYTDGEKLFCVSNGKIWLFEEQQNIPMITKEVVAGIPLEIGTYVYRLCEP